MTKFTAAYRAGTAPHIAQVYEVGTPTMIDTGAILTVYQISETLGESWNWAQYLRPILSGDGHLWSFPFNSSTSMLYYNEGILIYASVEYDPNAAFTSGAISMLLISMSLLDGIVKMAKFGGGHGFPHLLVFPPLAGIIWGLLFDPAVGLGSYVIRQLIGLSLKFTVQGASALLIVAATALFQLWISARRAVYLR